MRRRGPRRRPLHGFGANLNVITLSGYHGPGMGLWREIYGTNDWERLPEKAKAYVARLEEILDCPVAILSTGPDREHTIIRDPSLRKLLNR